MSAQFAHWTPDRIREVFDAHSEMQPVDIARITGRNVRDVIATLNHLPDAFYRRRYERTKSMNARHHEGRSYK